MAAIIRKANLTDANAIAAVHIQSWKSTYQGQIPDKILNDLSVEKRTQEWQSYLSSNKVTVFVIEQDKKIIGFASFCPSRDTDSDPKLVVEISAIYLLKEFWRKGLGEKLAEAIFLAAREKNYLEIITWVLEANSQARKFYEKIGFMPTGNFKTDHFGCEALPVMRYQKIL